MGASPMPISDIWTNCPGWSLKGMSSVRRKFSAVSRSSSSTFTGCGSRRCYLFPLPTIRFTMLTQSMRVGQELMQRPQPTHIVTP